MSSLFVWAKLTMESCEVTGNLSINPETTKNTSTLKQKQNCNNWNIYFLKLPVLIDKCYEKNNFNLGDGFNPIEKYDRQNGFIFPK